ncbi:unnamed protein product [Calypogeia fissa]
MRDSVVPSEEKAPRWTAAAVTLHAVQCARCLKWRIIPTKEHYESIREHILENPWVCESASSWRAESSCDIPADIQQDRNMLWAIDKPNLPSAPAGWERQITVRTDGSSKFADVYYTTPTGARLRSKVEIEKYIAKHPDSVPPKTTMDQFSFAIPRPLPGVCPQLTQAGGKLASPVSPVGHEDHELQRHPASQSAAAAEHNNTRQAGDHQAALVPRVTYPSTGTKNSSAGMVTAGDGNKSMQQLLMSQVTHSSSPQQQVVPPQVVENRPLPNKRRNPDLTPPNRRTKQQIKKDRLSCESSVTPSSTQKQPPGAPT